MKKVLIFLSSLLLAALIAVCAFPQRIFGPDESGSLGSATDNRATAASTTVFTVGNTAVLILPTSTSRTLARLASTSTAIVVSYGRASTVYTGEPLSSPLVIDLDRLYTGAIWAISLTTGTVSVTEFGN